MLQNLLDAKPRTPQTAFLRIFLLTPPKPWCPSNEDAYLKANLSVDAAENSCTLSRPARVVQQIETNCVYNSCGPFAETELHSQRKSCPRGFLVDDYDTFSCKWP